ncbi:MAG: hypothetical protein JWP95_1713 [Actinotalea sp.]|nr:hypothetical protein [Actinotalea sp.]
MSRHASSGQAWRERGALALVVAGVTGGVMAWAGAGAPVAVVGGVVAGLVVVLAGWVAGTVPSGLPPEPSRDHPPEPDDVSSRTDRRPDEPVQ